jgi:hypothetical protein
MRILAYCDSKWLGATLEVVGLGADVITSPPVTAHTFPTAWLSGYDVIYIDLNGEPGGQMLYDSEGNAALALDTVRGASLEGAVVVATVCHLPESPFLDAFLESGVRAVIAGEGLNWGASDEPVGAQRLAQAIIPRLARYSPRVALDLAKGITKLSLQRVFHGDAVRDALAFQVYDRGGNDETRRAA